MHVDLHALDWRPHPRVTWDVLLGPRDVRRALEHDVREGLGHRPRELPPKYFYDAHGSRLFEAITRLPEYYPTRREREILAGRAGEIAERARADTLVELGSGTSDKTRLLLRALAAGGSLRRFVPFDVDAVTLRGSALRIASEFPSLSVHAVVGDFERHVPLLPRDGRRLLAFLGGTIGNLAPRPRARFLADVAAQLGPADAFLLGTDLVKDIPRLEAAYNDAQGVTAEFNKNVLSVLNTELNADFDLDRFEHVARYDARQGWIEMLLRARVQHTVTVADLDLPVDFREGELLRTEISAKFTRAQIDRELGAAGMRTEARWTDRAGDFAVTLAVRA
ncbi:MAG TPA: L-histidine N(alpha)-methyltransferase [Myxococcaceae bacterium]|nr:L-histidine N(alpha)-methyltransferase [Myxococcaceae bacterium]